LPSPCQTTKSFPYQLLGEGKWKFLELRAAAIAGYFLSLSDKEKKNLARPQNLSLTSSLTERKKA